MTPIPKKLKEKILNSPEYKTCMRRQYFKDHVCEGRITLEHAMTYAGRQIQEWWAIISLCAKAHSVDQFQDSGILDKRKNQIIAMSRAVAEDKKKYPRLLWER